MSVRFAFAGDRQIAVSVLDFLIAEGARPEALMLARPEKASHAQELISRCPHLDTSRIARGSEFRSDGFQSLLRSLNLDYILGIHFPEIIPKSVLDIPREGVLNLHPAYLPFNRGWHTPSWAIEEGQPYGGTLHFMGEALDSGDIVHQKRLIPRPDETADELYQRVLALEIEVFKEAWPGLFSKNYPRIPQDDSKATMHRKSDLSSIQRLELDAPMKPRDLIRRLRALTTNDISEAAYFEEDGALFRVTIAISRDPGSH